MIINKSLSVITFAATLNFVSAARSVAEQSAIADPQEQCKYYDYPDVTAQISKFPKVWETAKIVSGDTEARAKFDAMSASIPKLPVKGLKAKATYDVKNDPDCWWTATECTKAKHEGVPDDLSLVPEPATLGYGFDDGPNCSHNAFYDYLTQQKQKATMFFIGSNVIGWPLQAKRALEDGHELCVHTWSHGEMTGFNDEEAFAEIYYTIEAIKLVTGATPTCFRPAFGDTDDRIRYITNRLGLRTILWKYDTFDTIPDKTTGKVEVTSVRQNYEKFLEVAKAGTFAREGAILLAHETNNMTMQEAVSYYPQLKAAFKNIVPVGVAMNITQPYVETQFSLPTFQEYVSGTIKTDGPAKNPVPGKPEVGKNTSKEGANASTSSGGSNTSGATGGSNSASSSCSFNVIIFYTLSIATLVASLL